MKLSKTKIMTRSCGNVYFQNLRSLFSVFCALSILFYLTTFVYAGGGFYSIQISSNKYFKNAESEVNRLKSKGHNAFYRHKIVKGQGWYKVYIGKYGTAGEAKVVVDSIKNTMNVKYKSIVKIMDPNIHIKPPKTKRNYSLHVSSFRSNKKANIEITRLDKLGINSFSEKATIKGKNWFRVYMGGFSDRSSADKRGFALKQSQIIAFYSVIKKDAPTEKKTISPPTDKIKAVVMAQKSMPEVKPIKDLKPLETRVMPEIKIMQDLKLLETNAMPEIKIMQDLKPFETKAMPEVKTMKTFESPVANAPQKEKTLNDKYLKEMNEKKQIMALEKAKKAFAKLDFQKKRKPEQTGFKNLMHELLLSHEMIKFSKDNIDYAKHVLRESKSGYLPSLDLSSDYGYERISKQEMEKDTEEFRNSSNLRATQLITDFGLTTNYISKSKKMVKRSQYELEANRQKLLLDGITSYLNVIRNREILKYFKKSENNIKKQTGIEETLVEKGAGLSSNVLQAKAQLSNSMALVAISKGALETSKNNFRAIFKKSLTRVELSRLENPPLRLVPISIDFAIETSLKKNMNITIAKINSKIIQRDLKAKKAAFYPKLNLFADDTYSNNEDGIEGYKNDAAVGIELSYNLYRGGGDKALVNAAKSNLSASNHQLTNIRYLIEEQTRNAWQNLETLKIQTKLLEDQANIASEFLKLARKERRLGNRSLLDILNGEITYINAVSSAISSKIDMKIAVYNLLYVTGQLNLNVL